jgi:glycosyltransferase involved in cell wall biosynthesis
VHFCGFRQIDETPAFYALADAFILPSLREEWGLVVNEAMASGLPVVVSETAGCAEDLLAPGWPDNIRSQGAEWRGGVASAAGCRVCQNGFLFNPLSSDALAGALLELEASPGLREVMGRASRSIVDKFSCAHFAENALLAARAALGHPASVPVAGVQDNRAVASIPRAN